MAQNNEIRKVEYERFNGTKVCEIMVVAGRIEIQEQVNRMEIV